MKIEITHSERVNNDFTDVDKYTPSEAFSGWIEVERWIAERMAAGGFWIRAGAPPADKPKIWIPWRRVVKVEILP
jgi:hypothetical protein